MQPASPAVRPVAKSPLFRAGLVVGARYRLRESIGVGAMGEVWRADHVTLGTPLAVKLVDTTSQPNPAALLARFQLEARAAAQLKSPNVVQILDHGVDGHVAFIAMEHLDGENLEQRLARRRRLPLAEVADLLREMARGVDRAHAAAILHRDLKPSNVFLARSEAGEVVKVLDFGIAKVVGGSRESHLETQAGVVIGTPAYMSPEQVLGMPLDSRSDLWQMAVIGFECMTGKRPFDGASLGQLFQGICSSPLPMPSSLAPDLPTGVDAWFLRAAARDPPARFASAGEMADALAQIAGSRRSSSPAPMRAPDDFTSSGGSGAGTWTSGGLEMRPKRSTAALFATGMIVPLGLAIAFVAWNSEEADQAAAAAASASAAAHAAAPRPREAAVTEAPSSSPPQPASASSSAATARATASAITPRSPLAPKGHGSPSNPRPEPQDPIGL